MSRDEKRLIMDRANDAKLRIAGIPVQVSGAALDFARVTVRNGHPLSGFSAEYSWETIRGAIQNGGGLS